MILGIGALIIYAIFFNDSDKSYSLESIHYDVNMLSNGDALVTEERVYSFEDGNFTRGFFNLEEGIEDIVVYEGDRVFTKIEDFSASRPEGSYTYKEENGKIRLEWYIRAQGGEKHTYSISYKVKEATVLYNDCAVYFQKFLSQDNTTKIGKITATIHLIQGANSNNTLIWGHGPANGIVEFDSEDDSKVNLEITNVPINNYVEARFVLDRKLMPNVQYIENINMKERVIEEETKAAKEADKNRRIAGITSVLAYIIGVALILLPIYMRFKKKENFTRYKPEIEPDFYRDIPSDIPPAMLDKLYYYYGKKGSISNQISGTVLDLIQRNIISVSYNQMNRKKEILLSQKEYEPENITKFEKAILDFLFRDVGEKREFVSINEIKKYCKKKKHINSVSRMIDGFTQKLEKEWEKQQYEEKVKNMVPNVFPILKVLSILTIIVSFYIFASIENVSGAALILIVAGFISFIINIFISKKKKMLTEDGESSLALWKGLYNFLNDFTSFDEKELPELFMWERYLVYASVFGIAEKVLKQLKIKYPQLQNPEYINKNMVFYSSLVTMDIDPIDGLKDIESSIQTAVRDAQSIITNLSKSSSSGKGGGFSSGGSSGGSGAGGSTGGGMD